VSKIFYIQTKCLEIKQGKAMDKRILYPLIVIVTFIASSLALAIVQVWGVVLGIAIVILIIIYTDWLREMGILSYRFRREYVNLEDALKNNIMKYGKFQNTILMYQGELSPVYFENKTTLNILDNAAERGVKIHIVFGPKTFRNKEIMKMVKEGKITLYQREKKDEIDIHWEKYKKEGKFNHFIYVDGKWVWLEKPHKTGECDSGVVFSDSPLIAKACYDRFYETAQTCKRIDKDSVVESIGAKNFLEFDEKSKEVRQCTEEEIEELKNYLGE